MCRDYVHADLPALWSSVGPYIVHGERQILPGLGDALLRHLACELRERQLRLQCRTELMPTKSAIELDHRLHEQIGGGGRRGLYRPPPPPEEDGGVHQRHPPP